MKKLSGEMTFNIDPPTDLKLVFLWLFKYVDAVISLSIVWGKSAKNKIFEW